MGREMIFEVRKNNQPIWPDPNNIDAALYVCGRDDATTFLASYVNNCVDDDSDDDETPTLLLRARDEKLTYIKERLKEYKEKDYAEIQKAKDTLEDLRAARRNSATMKDFADFSDAMAETEQWLAAEDWSRAGSMLEYLEACESQMLSYINADEDPDREKVLDTYKVAIIWSE